MAEYQYINCRNLLSLPDEIESVFSTLGVPPRLYAHSLLVHDVANKLLEKINGTWKNLNINKDLVLFGAAGHDIGKSVYINELSEEGHKHEREGFRLLRSLGFSEEKSQFAASHALWSESSTLEELAVSLADKIWKGSRVAELEDLAAAKIAAVTNRERWEVFRSLDTVIQTITRGADKRLFFQNNFSTITL
ncbi:HD domain-containing protein [Treponema sp. Marseille-Q4132]|uniref:HD domain-containing protein n=1 Tax=Treponema sp. Marseille-Q4132 TaxID=2766701 RepID=UPI001652D554|nr:HD domain-containing protein [Treponema sp. Marseille-Q4132]QNL97071.1 HD domain-containing protein [Treponema sp. Marseille-Q4132]